VDDYLANYQSQPPQPIPEVPQASQAPQQSVNRGPSVVVRPSQLSPNPNRAPSLFLPETRQSTSPTPAEPRYYYNPNYVDARNKTPENERQNSPSQVPLPSLNQPEDAPIPPKFSVVQPARVSGAEQSVFTKADTLRPINSEREGGSGSRFGPANSAPEAQRRSHLSFGNASSRDEPTPPQSERVSVANQSGYFGTASFQPSQDQSYVPVDPRVSTAAQKYSMLAPNEDGVRLSTLDMSKVIRKSATKSTVDPSQGVRPIRAASAPVPVDFYQQVQVEEVDSQTPLAENTERNLAIIDQFVAENGLEPAVEHIIYNKEDEEFVLKLKEDALANADPRRSSNGQPKPSIRGSTQKFKIVPLFQLDSSRADALVDQGGLTSEPVSSAEWYPTEQL